MSLSSSAPFCCQCRERRFHGGQFRVVKVWTWSELTSPESPSLYTNHNRPHGHCLPAGTVNILLCPWEFPVKTLGYGLLSGPSVQFLCFYVLHPHSLPGISVGIPPYRRNIANERYHSKRKGQPGKQLILASHYYFQSCMPEARTLHQMRPSSFLRETILINLMTSTHKSSGFLNNSPSASPVSWIITIWWSNF